MGELCDTYKWPHDFWRRMGWREFWRWVAERDRMLRARAQGQQASAHSWAGRANDAWWAQQDVARRGGR